MDPRFTSWLTESQYRRKHDDIRREFVVYRPPVDRLRPRLARAARRHLAGVLLALGARLSDEPRIGEIAPNVEPASRTR